MNKSYSSVIPIAQLFRLGMIRILYYK